MNNESVDLNKLLKKGTWILIPYGFCKKEFCVLDVKEDNFLLGRSAWCVSDAKWMSKKELDRQDGSITGHSRYRWWRIFIPFCKDLIFPYSKLSNR